MGKLNDVKIIRFPKLIYNFNTIDVQIPAVIFCRNCENGLKILLEI